MATVLGGRKLGRFGAILMQSRPGTNLHHIALASVSEFQPRPLDCQSTPRAFPAMSRGPRQRLVLLGVQVLMLRYRKEQTPTKEEPQSVYKKVNS